MSRPINIKRIQGYVSATRKEQILRKNINELIKTYKLKRIPKEKINRGRTSNGTFSRESYQEYRITEQGIRSLNYWIETIIEKEKTKGKVYTSERLRNAILIKSIDLS